MTVIPVTPVDREKLVAVTTNIVIDFTGSPASVTVDSTTVYDAGVFLASWTGSLINVPTGGKRLVLTPPAEFGVGQLVEVNVVEVGGTPVSYVFQTGVRKATLTDDVSSPAVVITPAGDYLGYVKSPGTLYVRFLSPLSPEVQMIAASVVDIGYDPTLNKLIVFFVNNGVVYATTADPGDGPNTILPPGEAATPTKAVAYPYDDVKTGVTGGGGEYQTYSSAAFLPVKLAAPVDSVTTNVTGSEGPYGIYSGFPQSVTPIVVGINPRVLRIPRPTTQPEASQIVGFYLFKTSKNYATGRVIDVFIPIAENETYAEYTDPAPTPDAAYAVISVYRNGQTTGLVQSPVGNSDTLLTATGGIGADVVFLGAAGSEGPYGIFSISGTFLPVKLAVPLDTVATNVTGGAGAYYAFSQ